MTDEYISTISERYIELYEQITGEKFIKVDLSEIKNRINTNVVSYLS